ncbi:MAG: hypothetical protein IKM95_07340 [Bacteroidales bacterium]|nr:hypothetical protein [Bacteroidales bacterium]
MHPLKTFLSQITIKNFHGEEISKESKEYLYFIDFVDELCSAKNRTILYRGCNPEPIFQTKLFDIQGFSNKMFMLGEKSHLFESNKYPLICIDDCSIAVFEFVFDRLHDKVCNLSFSNPNSLEKVKLFLEANPSINKFFSNKNNKERFINKISAMDDSSKRHVLDYYFSLLHTIGKSANGNSFFISTSKSIKIAEQFKNDGILVITWVPSSERNRQILCYKDINKLDNFIKAIGLPYFESSPYSNQEEVGIKGGILPHYIIGYADKDSFIVNPNLITQISSSYDFESLLKDGILTDQTHFDNVLQKTKYKGGFLCKDGFYLDY